MATANTDFWKTWVVTPEKVTTLVERIIKEANPAKIIVFGSRARGTARPDSDLDLAVIFDELTPGMEHPLPRHKLSDIHMPFDVVVTDKAHHERFRHSRNSVHHCIDQEGQVLYDRDARRADPDSSAQIG